MSKCIKRFACSFSCWKIKLFFSWNFFFCSCARCDRMNFAYSCSSRLNRKLCAHNRKLFHSFATYVDLIWLKATIKFLIHCMKTRKCCLSLSPSALPPSMIFDSVIGQKLSNQVRIVLSFQQFRNQCANKHINRLHYQRFSSLS